MHTYFKKVELLVILHKFILYNRVELFFICFSLHIFSLDCHWDYNQQWHHPDCTRIANQVLTVKRQLLCGFCVGVRFRTWHWELA